MSKKKNKKKNKVINDFTADKAAETAAAESSTAFDETDEYAEAEKRAATALEGLDEDERAELIAAPAVEIPRCSDISEDDIALSIEALRSEDITVVENAENHQRRRKRKKLGIAENLIMLAVFALCASVVIYCVTSLVKSIRDKIIGEELYSNTEFDRFVFDGEKDTFNHPLPLTMLDGDASMMTLYDRIANGSSGTENVNSQYSKKLDAMRASLTALKAKNKEVYGWIYVENTVIDHPIMQGSDNSYYLDHAYTGEALPIGSIYADSTAKEHLTDNYNAVLYGHNVVDVAGSKSSMFHDITKFFDEAFFAENKIYIYTMEGVFIFKPVSIYTTEYDSEYYRVLFNSEEDFTAYANSVVQLSKIPSGASFTAGDRMLSMYTCTNGVNNFRFVLHSKLIETIR